MRRIVFQESALKGQGRESTVMQIGNASINYSHNYEQLCARHGFRLADGGWRDKADKPDLQSFAALVERA